MNEEEIKQKIEYLRQHIPRIKNKKTRLQQQKYMHRLQKELNIYNFYMNRGKI